MSRSLRDFGARSGRAAYYDNSPPHSTSNGKTVFKYVAAATVAGLAAKRAYDIYNEYRVNNIDTDGVTSVLLTKEIFISEALKNFLKERYDVYMNTRSNNLKTVELYVKLSIYQELMLFITIINRFDIIKKYSIFKTDIIKIMCSDDFEIIKRADFNLYNLNIDGIIDYKNMMKNSLLEIRKNFGDLINNELKIIEIIDKHFINNENIKIFDELKIKLNENIGDSDLFFKLFDNVNFHKNAFYENTDIVNNITENSIFTLKKYNDTYILLEIFNNIDINTLVNDTEFYRFRQFEKFENYLKDNKNNKIKTFLHKFINLINNGDGAYHFQKIFQTILALCIYLFYIFMILIPMGPLSTMSLEFTKFIMLMVSWFSSIIITNYLWTWIEKFINYIITTFYKFFSKNEIKKGGGGKTLYYYHNTGFNNKINNKLTSLKLDKNYKIPLNEIKKYNGEINNISTIVSDSINKMDCLIKTNLFNKNNINNNNITNIWNNLKKDLDTPNISNTPNYLNIPSNNSQLGGDPIESNIEFTKYINTNIKMQYSYQIVSLLKKALLYLNNNNIYLDEETINDIKHKINIIENTEEELNNNTKNIIKAGRYISKEKIILNNDKLIEYIDKNKMLYSKANNISTKLGHVLLEMCNSF